MSGPAGTSKPIAHSCAEDVIGHRAVRGARPSRSRADAALLRTLTTTEGAWLRELECRRHLAYDERESSRKLTAVEASAIFHASSRSPHTKAGLPADPDMIPEGIQRERDAAVRPSVIAPCARITRRALSAAPPGQRSARSLRGELLLSSHRQRRNGSARWLAARGSPPRDPARQRAAIPPAPVAPTRSPGAAAPAPQGRIWRRAARGPQRALWRRPRPRIRATARSSMRGGWWAQYGQHMPLEKNR